MSFKFKDDVVRCNDCDSRLELYNIVKAKFSGNKPFTAHEVILKCMSCKKRFHLFKQEA